MPCSFPGSWTFSSPTLQRETLPALALALGAVNALPAVLAASQLAPDSATMVVAALPAEAASVAAPQPAVADAPAESALPGDAPGNGTGTSTGDLQGPGLRLAQAQDAASGAVVAAPAQSANVSGEALGTGFRFTVAPIRWGGNLAYNLSWTRAEDSPSRIRHVQLGNLRGATYLWQPWFAQVSGSIGYITGVENSSGGDAAISGSTSRGRDTSLTGSLNLSLFPLSRFPFSAGIERTDSRSSGAFVGSDFTSTRLSLRQDYTPLRAPFSFTGGYDRNIIDDSRLGRDTVDSLRGGMTWRGQNQSASLNASHVQNRGTQSRRSQFDIVSGRHNWQFSPQFSVDSIANLTRSDTSLGGLDGSGDSNRITTIDLGSTAIWRPETENPLSVSAFARLFRTASESGGVSDQAQALTAGASASYSPTPNLALNGSGQVSQTRTSGESDFISLLTAGASYSGDPRKLGEFDYNWNTSGTVSLETGSEAGNTSTLTLNAAHSVARNFVLSERSTVAVSAFQNVGAIRAGATGNIVTLGHSLSAAWSMRQSESFVTTLSAGGSDTRFFGNGNGSFQQLSVQLNGNMYISRYSSATAALAIQGVRQDTEDSRGGGFNASAYGTLGYQHMQLLGVPRLRYSALYSANTQDLGSRRQGNAEALPRSSTHSLEQRLDYRVGRLDLQALLRVSIIEGKNNSFLFFSVNREFGAF